MKPNRTLFVTGATGFLGGHFVPLALAQGWRLRCLVRDRRPAALRGVEWVRGDLRRNGPWTARLKGCNAVVHLAVVPLAECDRHPSQSLETIVGGAKRLVQAAIRARVKQMIAGSTGEVYGSPRRLPVTEDALLKPLSLYGFFKACSDLITLSRGHQNGIPVCVLRFFNLYGPKADGTLPNNVLRLFAEHILRDEPVILHGSVRNSRDFLHVQDAARALLLVLKQPELRGVFNVCSGRETTLLQLARRMARLTKRRLRVQVQPHEGRVRRVIGDCSRARRVLGFTPKVSLDEGLREMLYTR